MADDSLKPLLYQERSQTTRVLTLLGASGSVGTTTLRFLKTNPAIELEAISVHSRTDLIPEIIRDFPVKFVCISNEQVAQNSIEKLKSAFAGVNFFAGPSGLSEMVRAAERSDTVLTAVVGSAGIDATLAAIRAGKKIALANKETLVTAGPAIAALLNQSDSSMIPVDSEHNAIFQVYLGRDRKEISKVILTASGGPFRDWSVSEIKKATKEQVLNHPTWSMGPKITVDSAGMINKGLEMIEAHFLFGMPFDRIDAVIHRKSFVHGMVQTSDGAYLLGVSRPDMVYPVAHALCFPGPVPAFHEPATDPHDWPDLSFEPVTTDRYPGFKICTDAGRSGGTAPAVLNAANEVAVALFLNGRIGFTDIPDLLKWTLDSIPVENGTEPGLFIEADRRARDFLQKRYR